MPKRFIDSDKDRLAEHGLKRKLGYDGDTKVSTFEAVDGSIHESKPGSEYEGLKQVSRPSPSTSIRRSSRSFSAPPRAPTRPDMTFDDILGEGVQGRDGKGGGTRKRGEDVEATALSKFGRWLAGLFG
jgi:hypothetical protein